YRRLGQLDRHSRPGGRCARQSRAVRDHPAGADRAPARARPCAAPRPLRRAAVVFEYFPRRVSQRQVRAARGQAAVLHAGRLAGHYLVAQTLAMWAYILKRLLLMIPTLLGVL